MRPPHDRLNGWKEIAAHLGKGVRTVQRWERQYGLPVRRLGDQVEVVFAFRSEIDAWAENRQGGSGPSDRQRALADRPVATPTDVAPRAVAGGSAATGAAEDRPTAGRSWRVLGLAGLVAFAVVAWLAVPSRPLRAVTANPADWDLTDDTLRVFDENRALLWSYRFPTPLRLRADRDAPQEQPVYIGDYDGDGLREVIAAPLPIDRSRAEVLWFDARGEVSFRRSLVDTVHFGREAFAPPWVPARTWVTGDGTGRRSVWTAFIHSVWYPTVLEEYAPTGRVGSRYWSNGYIGWVGTGTWRGRPVVLVGAANNESGGGSLAILPRDWRGGTAPAENPEYRCADCPRGTPLEFLVFPRSCVLAQRHQSADVIMADFDALGRLVVSVQQLPVQPPPYLQVKYSIDADLARASIEVTPEFMAEHERLRKAGMLDHPLDDRDVARMLPVKRWVDGGFQALAVVRD